MPLKFRTTGLSLGRKLQKLRSEGKTIARAAIASTVRDLILEGFIRETDPRGRKWAPRKDALPHPILDKTGAMQRGFEIDTRGAQLVVENNVVSKKGFSYPRAHQEGTSKMVARKPLPDQSMPPHWRAEFDKTVRVSLERLK